MILFLVLVYTPVFIQTPHLLRLRYISVADIHTPALLLLRTNYKDEIVLLQLTCANLLLHSVSCDVNINVHSIVTEDFLQLEHIIVDSRHNRDDEDLTR